MNERAELMIGVIAAMGSYAVTGQITHDGLIPLAARSSLDTD